MYIAVKKAWVKALRSGDFRECNGVFRKIDEDGREHLDALGVLLKVTGAIWLDCWEDGDVLFNRPLYNGRNCAMGEDDWMDRWFIDMIGLTEEEHDIVVEQCDNGTSFAELADWIETYIPNEELPVVIQSMLASEAEAEEALA